MTRQLPYPHVHLVGIGGAGLSAIATVLHQQGHTVSGSDAQDSPTIARLRQMGLRVHVGHLADHLGQADAVVVSSAIPAHNPEVVAARAQNIPVFERPGWLGLMTAQNRSVAIAGTHGKTTTTTLTTLALLPASPSYIIGGYVPQLNGSAAAGHSDLFIIEADEYARTFLSLKPALAVVTNIEVDHPDIYPSEADLHAAFAQFAALVPPHGRLFLCGDDPGARRLLNIAPTDTYGFDESNTWQASELQINQTGQQQFQVRYQNKPLTTKPVRLQAAGRHNVLNALAAFAVAHTLGQPPDAIAAALEQYRGVERRFELKGERNGVTIIDDYAHHPTEIRATLAAARARFATRRLWAIFQPHTFSRTRLLLAEFAAAFDDADRVGLLDIFPSREKDDGSLHSRDILAQMHHPHATYLGSINDASAALPEQVHPGDVVITLGAGDSYKVGEALLQALQVQEATR